MKTISVLRWGTYTNVVRNVNLIRLVSRNISIINTIVCLTISISTLQCRGLKLKTSCGKFLNLAHYFPYDVKLGILAYSRSFLAYQKARNAIVVAENLLKCVVVVVVLEPIPLQIAGLVQDSLSTLVRLFHMSLSDVPVSSITHRSRQMYFPEAFP